jgi:hypothetical protein
VHGPGERERLHHQALVIAVRRGALGDAHHDPLEALLAGNRNVLDQPLHQARKPQHDQQRADQAQRERYREGRDQCRIVAEDVDAEGQRDQEREEDAEDPEHLLERRRRRDLHRATREARRVVELVTVEARGARKERPDEAADQERTEDVRVRQLDLLPAQQDLPAAHRGQDAEELDAGGGGAPDRKGARLDLGHGVEHQPPGGHLGAILHRHRVGEQQPEGPDRHPGLEPVEDATTPGLGRESRHQDREDRNGQDLEKDQHEWTRSTVVRLLRPRGSKGPTQYEKPGRLPTIKRLRGASR